MKRILIILSFALISNMLFGQTFNASPNAAITNDGQHCYTINVTGIGTIDGTFGLESVCIDITHTWDSDLSITLLAPDGTSIDLSLANGGSDDNYTGTCFEMTAATSITAGTAPFTGSFIPVGDFATANNGQNADGAWELCIEDGAGGDDGTFNDWSITFGAPPPPPAPITITACTGTFSDLNGTGNNPASEYDDNESQTWTICPDVAGMDISLVFTQWDIEPGTNDDQMIIYDGDDATAPQIGIGDGLNAINGVIQPSAANPTGCLTFVWSSDGDGITGDGWEADISCVLACQNVQTQWNGSTPADVGGYIDICQGETVDFSALGVYENNGTYVQADATSVFDWDFGDGNTATGQNVSHTFPTEGGYDINLIITDVNGCVSTNDLGIRVRVSTTPTFAGTVAATDPVCLGSCSQLTGVPNMTPWSTPPGQVLAGTTFLPDGSGVSYTTSLIFDNFTPGATVTSLADIVEICANIEHSYAGDLQIEIECPDGSTTVLVDYAAGTNLGWDHVGEPIDDTDATGGSVPEGPGVGYDYCWSPTGLITWNDAGGDAANVHDYTDVNGATYTGISYIPAGTYDAMGDWTALIGCPLNGAWSINVTDNLGSDDGYIFEWGISFDPSLYPNGWGFTNTVVSEAWTGTTVTAGNPTTACPPDLGTEDYVYTIIDDYGCSYDTTITITAVGISVDTASVNPTCAGDCDGTITISNPTGGTAPFAYTYAWAGGNAAGQTTAAVTGLCAGTYTVTVSESGITCTNVQTFTLVDPPALTIALAQTAASCGAANGEINVDVTNGTAPIDYVWQVTAGTGTTNGNVNNETDPYDITGLEPSTYSVTATDANGCEVIGSIVVQDAGNVVAGFTTSANQCLEGNSFDFTNTSATTTGIIYDVAAPAGGTSAPGLVGTPDYTGFVADAPGVWTVTQTITSGSCTDDVVLTFTVYDEPQLSLNGVDATCNQLNTGPGTNDGSITATVTNSNGGENYTFTVGTGSFTGNVASGLSADTYEVVITDMFGCNDTATYVINEPAAIQLTLTSTPNDCNGAPCNGTANVDLITGGVGAFTYQWTGPATSETTQGITGLCAGTYNVTVYDSNSPGNGCYEVGSQIITEPAAETYLGDSLDATCGLATGKAIINVTTVPASATYEYTWFDNAALTPPSIGFTAASASLTNSLNNVAAGTYYVQVVNANGCTDVIPVTVVDNGSPTLTVTSATNILCNGDATGEITVEIGGTLNPDFTYIWQQDGIGYTNVGPTSALTDQQTNLTAGTYDVTVQDAAGCQASVNVVLTEPSAMTGSIAVVDANCSTMGSLTANIAGGETAVLGVYSYQWDNDGTADPATDPQMIAVGTGVYNVTVYDDNNCEFLLNATVNDIGGIDADTTINSHTLCFESTEGSITANPIGGIGPYNYDWTPNGFTGDGTNTYSNLPAGTYNCVVTDANGCGAVTSAIIIEPTEVVAGIVDTTMVTCFNGTDGTITAGGTGGAGIYTYQWDLQAANQTTAQATGLSAGCYTVTVYDLNMCFDDTTVCISEPAQLVLTVDAYEAHCDQADGSASVNITGGTPPYPVINWSSGMATGQADSTAGLPFGSYSVTVIDNNGCQETVNFNIDSIQRGVITISDYDDVLCFGENNGMIQVSVGGGGGSNTYNWDNGIGNVGLVDTIGNLFIGTYNVTATDAWGCELYAQQTIIEPIQLNLTINKVDDRCSGTCEGTADAIVAGGTLNYSYQWDDGMLSTTPGLTDLCAGWYRVTATDGNGCSVIDSIEITEPLPITVSAVIDSSSCNQSDGGITLTPINGTPPFTYVWNPDPVGSVDSTLIGIPQGSYDVTVLDSKNCPFDTSFVVYDQNSPIVQIDSIFDPLCNGDNNGSVYASANGGVTPYTWNWDSDSLVVTSTSDVATNLDGGNVCVTVTDINGCQSTACTTLVENPALVVTITTQNVLCNGDSTGWANAVVTGGTGLGTYTYSWTGIYNGLTPDQAMNTGLPSGTYSLLVTDANGCTYLTNNIVINEPLHISLSTSFTPVLCNGDCDGTATVTATGGTGVGTYQYLWPDNQTSSTASGLCAGTYVPTVTDDNGCVDSTIVVVTEPTPFVLDSISYEHISCYGACDAWITTYVSGGILNYTYQYDGPSGFTASTQTVSSLCLAGNYSIHIEDANGCEIDTFHIVNQPPELTESFTKIDETCYSYCDGEIDVQHNGGSGNHTIVWSNPSVTGFNPIDLCPGTYTYTITDENDCEVSNTVVIDGNPLLDIYEESHVDATCGQCDGQATVSIVGGAGIQSITWFGGDFSNCTPATPYPDGGNSVTQTQLPQGIHFVYVEDMNGCRDTVPVTIQNLTGPTIDSVSVVDVLCYGESTGTIVVHITGGANPLGYTWADDVTQTNSFRSALNAGTYYFSVTDANDCIQSVVVEVDQNDELFIDIININDAVCNGEANGSATIQGFGGTGAGTYTYGWSAIPSQSAVTAIGLPAGNYIGSITDANGCQINEAFAIGEPDPITLVSEMQTSTTCAYPQICDGSVTVIATGGNSSVYNYNWFGNGANQNSTGSLCAGLVQLQVTDPQGCTGDFTFDISQPDTIQVTLGQDPIACNDPNGMIWIENITGGTASAYYNTYSDHMDNAYPLNGGWTCTWDVQAAQAAYVNGVYNQYYSVQVFDPSNLQCSVTQGITVGEVPEPYLFSQNTTPTSCNGITDGEVRIEVKQGTPEFYYNWIYGNNMPFPAGADTVVITNLEAGTYTLTVVDDNGCEVPTSFIITEPNEMSVTTTQTPNETICISENVIVYANGAGGTPPYKYDWNSTDTTWSTNSAQIFAPINDTIVYIRIKDRNDCPAFTQRAIFVHDSLNVSLASDGEICEGENFTLQMLTSSGGNGNYTYFWSSGDDTENSLVTPTVTQTYYFTLRDNCGSPDVMDSLKVVVNPNPYVQTITRRDSCEPLGMIFMPYPEDNDVHYHWNFGDPISGNNESDDMYPSHLFNYAGSYDISLDLTTDKGCTYDTIFENWIEVYPLPEADFGMTPNPASLFNNTVAFTDLTVSEDAIDNIQWDFGNGETGSYLYLGSLPNSTYDAPGYFDVYLFAETRNGCKDTITKVLRVNDEYQMYVPDAFTPGQDGRNDYFYPKGHGIDGSKEYELVIYDRWGVEIFKTNVLPYGTDKKNEQFDPEQLLEEYRGWNGKYQNAGKFVQNGVYSWYVKVIDVNGVAHEAYGKVTVIR